MKLAYLLIPLATVSISVDVLAQTRIFRCGNTYTNDEAQAKANGCKAVEGGNVTVVQGTRVIGAQGSTANSTGNRPPPASASASGPRVDSAEQRARDSDARTILEAELKKAEARQAELLAEYNNGEPEKLGPETRNHQKWLDRVADLKASIERNANDIAGLKRELGRTSGATPSAQR